MSLPTTPFLPPTPYPPARYDGAAGEVSARFEPAGRDPDQVNPNGVRIHLLGTSAGTGGDFGLYRWDFGPTASGPDPHFHRAMSESFFVLSGEVGLYDGDSWRTASSGDFLFVPPGGIHAFRNASPGMPTSMLLLFAPGAPRESYFRGLVGLAGADLTDDQRTAFYEAHDQFNL